MDIPSDSQLLRAYAERRSEAAFAELVRRHVDFVHSAALRMVRDPQLAEDVSQGVFLALAKHASRLATHAVLSGWLHRTARNIAVQTVRTETRRRHREQEASAMNEPPSNDPTAWDEISPLLDAAIAELGGPERDAVLLRYFENKSAKEMAELLGITAEAAQKRVSRAVERLREGLDRRGVLVSAAGLTGAIATHGVQLAPAGLAAAISAAAAAIPAAGAALVASRNLLMTSTQKALLAATCVALTGAGIYLVRTTSRPLDPEPMAQSNTDIADHATRPRQDPSVSESMARVRVEKRLKRPQELPRLKERWLAIEDSEDRVEEMDALAKESVERLFCGQEAYELEEFLLERNLMYGYLQIKNEIGNLLKSPRGAEARQLLATLPEHPEKDKQYAILELWCHFAGQSCPEEEFAAFHASLKNPGCALEALLGHSLRLVKADPEQALRIGLDVIDSGAHSLSRGDHFTQFFNRPFPPDVDFEHLQSMLPPYSGNREMAQWTPTDWAWFQLLRKWSQLDPAAAAKFKAEHPDGIPQQDRPSPKDAEADG